MRQRILPTQRRPMLADNAQRSPFGASGRRRRSCAAHEDSNVDLSLTFPGNYRYDSEKWDELPQGES